MGSSGLKYLTTLRWNGCLTHNLWSAAAKLPPWNEVRGFVPDPRKHFSQLGGANRSEQQGGGIAAAFQGGSFAAPWSPDT